MLSELADEHFSWPIKAASTAAVLGSFYWTASVLAFLSWRRTPWADARAGVLGVIFLLWAMLITIVTHLDEFALSGNGWARVSAWIWLVLYVCYPILVMIALVIQVRAKGPDPARTAPLALAYRIRPPAIASVVGACLLVVVLAPYWPEFTWGGLRWSFILFGLVPGGLGVAGIWAGRGQQQARTACDPATRSA